MRSCRYPLLYAVALSLLASNTVSVSAEETSTAGAQPSNAKALLQLAGDVGQPSERRADALEQLAALRFAPAGPVALKILESSRGTNLGGRLASTALRAYAAIDATDSHKLLRRGSCTKCPPRLPN